MTRAPRPLSVIAREIQADLSRITSSQARKKGGRDPFYAARPYLEAMAQLDSVDDRIGADTGKTVILYALSNLANWRGDRARELKWELKLLA